ncbi:MAG: hypothetical protein HGA45_38400 [Chloroflexales bacterium]|nr:hypothetical protein [Chloroflexales bacterium]
MAAGDGQNQREALRKCAAGVEALSQGHSAEAADLFKQGLSQQPIAAASAIFNAAWAGLWRSSSDEIEIRLQLAAAVNEMTGNYRLPNRMALEAFNTRYPGFLADTYLLLALMGHERAPQLGQAGAHLRELEERREREAAGLDVKQLRDLEEAISAARQGWAELQREMVEDLALRHDPRLYTSMTIDTEPVTSLHQGKGYSPSAWLWRHVMQLDNARKGHEILPVIETLVSEIDATERDGWALQATRERLLKRVRELAQLAGLPRAFAVRFNSLAEFIATVGKPDSVTRDSLTAALEQLTDQLAREAKQLIEHSESVMREFPELRRPLSQFYYMSAEYGSSLQALTGIDKVILQCAFPYARLQVVGSEENLPALRTIERVWLEPGVKDLTAPQAIWVSSKAIDREPVLQVAGLRPDEVQHLADVFGALTANELQAACTYLPPAYALPLLAIPVPPRAQCWRKVIDELRFWLQITMAYLVAPPDGRIDAACLADYDRVIPVLGNNVTLERIQGAFAARLLGRQQLPLHTI